MTSHDKLAVITTAVVVIVCYILLAAVAHGATYRETCAKAYGNDRTAVAACVALAQDLGRGRRVVVDTE